MSKHAQAYLDAAPDRLADAERDRRFLSGVMVVTCVELGTLASELARIADAGKALSPEEVRGIAAGLEYVARELRESSRFEAN